MADIEKVIQGLKHCMSANETCEGCPYYGTTCTTTLNDDAIALLKRQQERIETLESLRRIEQEGR